jgi:hypothetical protein
MNSTVPTVSGVQRKIAALGAVAVTISVVAGRPRTWGVLLGVGLVASSLWLYAVLFDTVVRKGRRRLALSLTFAKLAILLALGWLVVVRGAGKIDPLGVAVGVTCLPLAALWEALTVRGK